MAVTTGSGFWTARYSGRQLYVGGRIDGLAEAEIPTSYFIFAADSAVQVRGGWTKTEIDRTLLPTDPSGRLHGVPHSRGPASPATFSRHC